MKRQAVGKIGEELASKHLVYLGYQVIERNFQTRFGELDIIAIGRKELVFCEVKTRRVRSESKKVNPLEMVNSRKRNQLRRIAIQWLTSTAVQPNYCSLRFDAIGILLDPTGNLIKLEHIAGAF